MTTYLEGGLAPRHPTPARTSSLAGNAETMVRAPAGRLHEAAARSLAVVWQALTTGQLRVARHFMAEGRLGLCLFRSPEITPLSEREKCTLHKFLTGRAQKVVSVDEGVAASTITGVLQHALRRLGLFCMPSRVPFLVAAAAHAAGSDRPVPGTECSQHWLGGTLQTVVTIHDPRAWLSLRLTPSQTEVTLLKLEGLTHSQIAARRCTTQATVANLLAAAYRRLEISGRLELMALVASEYQLGNVPLPAAPDR